MQLYVYATALCIILYSMTGGSSETSHWLQTLTALFCNPCKVALAGGGLWQGRRVVPPPFGGYVNEGLRLISTSSNSNCSQPNFPKGDCRSPGVEVNTPRLPHPDPPKSGIPKWVKWVLGSVISFMIPFWKNKWDNLRKLEGKAERVVVEAELAAEVVEKVSTAAEKALAEVADHLPDNSGLKEAAQVMEHVSEVTAHDAHLVQNIIHKVGDVKQDLEDLESMVDPILDMGKEQRPH